MAGSDLQFTKKDLRQITDDRSWERGVGYFDDERVEILLVDDGVIHARVAGTDDYRVQLWVKDGEIEGECSCPMGDDGVFCKHCVATGLAFLAGEAEVVEATGSTKARQRSRRRAKKQDKSITPDDVRTFLTRQDKSRLVEIIMDRLPWDDDLRQKLFLRAARSGKGGPNISAYRKTITDATHIGGRGFVEYRAAWDFVRRIDAAVDSIQELLDEGCASEVIELSEHAIARCEQALGSMDDSSGNMGGILERLCEIHHAACLSAKPDPEELARRLFRWEIETSYDTFYGAAETYADVLGKKGLTEYRRLAQSEWDKLPPLAPGQDRHSYDHNRYRLTSIMESLARASGDVEKLVAVMSKDLSSAYRYLQIAKVYQQDGQPDAALKWAECGLKEPAGRPDERLEDFVADEYHRRRRHDEAMALIWGQLERSPSLHTYTHLKKHADQAKEWSNWRQKALELVHRRIGEAQRRPHSQDRWAYHRPMDHSLLVEMYLWEKDAESAWQEAQVGGCSNTLWMTLAKHREKDHPADALAIYRKQIDPMVNQTGNDAYREATGLVRTIGQLMIQLGERKQFAAYLAEVRATHKRKRNFMKMLDRLD
ncbi:MAG: hypothetical protein GC162_00440 [Planctomycetes bacterium]|nr:hypothetical protein [Planctomycetota bacterium]